MLLDILILVLLIADIVLGAAVWKRMSRNDAQNRLDEKAQAGMDESAEEMRRSRRIDDGFENIMSYSVTLGHGRSTGGEP